MGKNSRRNRQLNKNNENKPVIHNHNNNQLTSVTLQTPVAFSRLMNGDWCATTFPSKLGLQDRHKLSENDYFGYECTNQNDAAQCTHYTASKMIRYQGELGTPVELPEWLSKHVKGFKCGTFYGGYYLDDANPKTEPTMMLHSDAHRSEKPLYQHSFTFWLRWNTIARKGVK